MSLYKGKVMMALTFYIMACPNYLQIHNVILSIPLASFSQAEYKNNITFISISKNVSADSLIIVLLLIYAYDHKQLDLKRL